MKFTRKLNEVGAESEERRQRAFSRTKVGFWPDFQLPIPKVEILHASLVKEGDFLIFFDPGDPQIKEDYCKKPPEEMYLRELFKLDIHSTEEVLAFTKDHGRLGDDNWKSLPAPYRDPSKYNEFQLTISRLRDEFWRSSVEDVGPDGRRWWAFDGCAHVTEITAHVTLLRDMVRIWDFIKDGITFSEMRESWENPIIPCPTDEDSAITIIESVLNEGLGKFDIRVHVKLEYDPDDYSRYCGTAPSLYSAMCLQLSNHVGIDASYSRCKNETCGLRFVHQRGRAKQGQNRKDGVRYCSPRLLITYLRLFVDPALHTFNIYFQFFRNIFWRHSASMKLASLPLSFSEVTNTL